VTIHESHPFAPTDIERARQLRGRLGNRVQLWCAGQLEEHPRPAGLTVSSALVVPGDPWRAVAFLDAESALLDAIESTQAATMTLLEWRHRQLAEMFAGRAPAPGGPFAQGDFVQEPSGPRPADATTYAQLALEEITEVGWMKQVTCRIIEVMIGADEAPLHHRRGRYAGAPQERG